MKPRLLSTAFLIPFFLFNQLSAQNVGVGEHHPGSPLSVKGGLAIGGDYSTMASPPSGAIIEGQIGVGTSKPDPNALIDFQSTDKGVLLPRLTTAQRNAIQSPATGLLVFDSDINSFYYYSGNDAAWVKMTGTASKTGTSSEPVNKVNSNWVFPGTEIQVSGGTTYNNINVTDATHINFVENSGTGAFYISAINNGVDGQMIILENDYNNNGTMIIPAANTDSNNAGRIYIQSKEKSSDLLVAAGKSVTLIYDGKKGYWKVVNWLNG
jgi:hypothetical protein